MGRNVPLGYYVRDRTAHLSGARGAEAVGGWARGFSRDRDVVVGVRGIAVVGLS
jgi:hypothetical protein